MHIFFVLAMEYDCRTIVKLSSYFFEIYMVYHHQTVFFLLSTLKVWVKLNEDKVINYSLANNQISKKFHLLYLSFWNLVYLLQIFQILLQIFDGGVESIFKLLEVDDNRKSLLLDLPSTRLHWITVRYSPPSSLTRIYPKSSKLCQHNIWIQF